MAIAPRRSGGKEAVMTQFVQSVLNIRRFIAARSGPSLALAIATVLVNHSLAEEPVSTDLPVYASGTPDFRIRPITDPLTTSFLLPVSEFPPFPSQTPNRFLAAGRAGMRASPVNQTISNRVAAKLSVHRKGILVERDGILANRGRRYAATLGRGFIMVEDSGWLEGIGHPAVAYRLSEVRAGGTIIAVGNAERNPVVAQTMDCAVSYFHGDVEERYRLDSDALEQEFVIRKLPASRGAITVTGLVSTNLTAPADGVLGTALSFTHRGREILSFSKSVAVDATGRSVPLEMAYGGGRLSITIPAVWVSQASLPITIDPVIGAPITVDSSLQSPNYQVSDI